MENYKQLTFESTSFTRNLSFERAACH
ncbi:hypothetical protein [Flavobacterium johnsoniae]